MVPDTLESWTLGALERLVAAGVFESRVFDLKEMLPTSADEAGKTRLRKTIAAFANGQGGFLIIGVADSKTLAAGERIVGVPPDLDVPVLFGAQASRCTPAVSWEPRNPPIQLTNGRLIHVVEIREAKTKPHGLFDGERWIFPKRTEGGNEAMSYEEIRSAFRDQHVVLAALNILRMEARRMTDYATDLNIELQSGNRPNFIYFRFRPSMFESALVQVLGHMTLEDYVTKHVDVLLGAVNAADEEITRLLAVGGDRARLIRLVLQALNHARLIADSLDKLA